jgi:hypothetical protein
MERNTQVFHEERLQGKRRESLGTANQMADCKAMTGKMGRKLGWCRSSRNDNKSEKEKESMVRNNVRPERTSS